MRALYAFLAIYLSAAFVFADKIVLLDQPKDSLQARADFIASSTESIRAQYFSIDDDFISKTGLALLAEAVRNNPNLKVRILVDSMHNSMKDETMAAILGTLNGKNTNIEIREYNQFNLFRPFRYNRRMHDKGIIFDGKSMISGGRNIANGYYGRSGSENGKEALPVFEDSDALLLESPAIETAARYFDNLWNSKFVGKVRLNEFSAEQLEERYCYQQHPDWSEQHRCLYRQNWARKKIVKEIETLNKLVESYRANQMRISPEATDWNAKAIAVTDAQFLYDEVVGQKSNLKKPKNNTGRFLYEAAAEAKESVIITTPYFVVTPEHEQLFKGLRERNVEVTVITNSKGSNDVPAVNVGYEKTRQKAMDLGVHVFEYQGPDTLHAKMVLIDKSRLFIGSYNWDFRSQNLNREVGILAKIDRDETNILSYNIIRKFSKILGKSCKVGDRECRREIRSESIEDLTDEELADLMAAFNARKSASEWLWRLTYPLIKKQL